MPANDLTIELESQIRVDFDQGRRNHLTDISLSIGAIVSSFVVAILVPIQGTPTWVTV